MYAEKSIYYFAEKSILYQSQPQCSMQRKNSIRYQKLHIMLVQHKEQEWQLQVKKKRKIRFLGEKREKDLLRIGLSYGGNTKPLINYLANQYVYITEKEKKTNN